MKRNHLLWIAPWIAFSLGACATVQRTETSKACAEWRWIAVRSPQAEACPEIPGWESPRPLFAPPADAKADENRDGYEKEKVSGETSEALRQLERFCVYETGKRLRSSPLPPNENGKLVRVDQDCAAISVAGTEWVPFSESFLDQAGKPEDRLEIKNRGGVRLAFLDTHPTGVGAPAERPKGELFSEHGYTLAHMARNLICSPPEKSDECAALITTRLALPIQKFHPKSRGKTEIRPRQGGGIGTQGDLAKAIQDEVDAWQQDLEREGAPQKLVLNLSVGWDGELFGDLDQEEVANLRAGTQAVYWALRYASSFDEVLVLAAAGNACKTCEKKSVGPLLPAAWEEKAPMEETRRGPQKQLVFAVGGVDAAGKTLANARENGMPRRAAYGASGVVPALVPCHSTQMYTGTSVATAVVSSIAAIVWDTLPNRDPGGIMRLIEDSGDDLTARDFNVRTNFFFRASTLGPIEPPPVRRISLCPALKAACAELGAEPGCPLQPETECKTWEPAAFASVSPRLRKCHPWVHTQPPEDPCPVCEPPRQ